MSTATFACSIGAPAGKAALGRGFKGEARGMGRTFWRKSERQIHGEARHGKARAPYRDHPRVSPTLRQAVAFRSIRGLWIRQTPATFTAGKRRQLCSNPTASLLRHSLPLSPASGLDATTTPRSARTALNRLPQD